MALLTSELTHHDAHPYVVQEPPQEPARQPNKRPRHVRSARPANKALARAGRTWADVDLVELNEAFASQSLACLRGWPDLDPEKLNVHGGALAIGHPLGASGGRIIGHAAHELARRGGVPECAELLHLPVSAEAVAVRVGRWLLGQRVS